MEMTRIESNQVLEILALLVHLSSSTTITTITINISVVQAVVQVVRVLSIATEIILIQAPQGLEMIRYRTCGIQSEQRIEGTMIVELGAISVGGKGSGAFLRNKFTNLSSELMMVELMIEGEEGMIEELELMIEELELMIEGVEGMIEGEEGVIEGLEGVLT